MKMIHLSDLHIGKSIDRFRLLEDQKYILRQILGIIKTEQPDAVLISGDVYDRGVPPTEAVDMLDEFLVALSSLERRGGGKVQTFVISGNHDSPERLAFCSRLMTDKGIHICPVYSGVVKPFVMNDQFGEVYIYMLPFVKPDVVRGAVSAITGSFDEAEKIKTYTQAVAKAIELMDVDESKRNVILSHQFVGNAVTCDSETVRVGGIDVVDPAVYSKFRYTALGHLHTPQTIRTEGGNLIYYSGTPLKYSFSERTAKSVACVVMDEFGNTAVRRIPLSPLRDMREVRGTFAEIMASGEKSEDFIKVILSDTEIHSNYYNDLRSLFPNIISFTAENARSKKSGGIGSDITPDKSELEIFGDFFSIMNGREMTSAESDYMQKLIEKIKQKQNDSEERGVFSAAN